MIVNVIRPDLGGGVLFSDLCEGLTERGIEVTLKCAYSYYPEWRDKSGLNGLRIARSTERGVHVERHGLFIPRNPNSLIQRLIYEASFYLSLRRRMPERGSFDAILVFCPLVGAVAYAVAVRKRLSIPLWLNVQDLSAQAAAAGGISGSRGTGRLLLRVQNYLFDKADLWSSISGAMVSTLQAGNRKSIPVKLIPNWLHPSLSHHIRAISGLRQVSSTTEPPTTSDAAPEIVQLLYSGNIGTKQDLVSFCVALAHTSLSFRFRIHGTGGGVDELTRWLDQTGDPRFELHPLTEERELASSLVSCDYYVITEKAGIGNSFIPSKLIPALAAATPILAICDRDSPLGCEMEEYRLGPRLDWSNLNGLSSVVSREVLQSDTYASWRMRSLERSVFYDRETAITRCTAVIEELLVRHSNSRKNKRSQPTETE